MAAITAAAAAVADLTRLPGVGPDVAMLASWRAVGLAVFAGAFGLLAWRPRGYPGVFELVIAHKLAMTIYGLVHLGSATDAAAVAFADGLLTVALLLAYGLSGAHLSWRPPRQDPDAAASDAVVSQRQHAWTGLHRDPVSGPDDDLTG